jgi:hypothetical protein
MPQEKDVTLDRKAIESMIQALAVASGVTQEGQKYEQQETAGPPQPTKQTKQTQTAGPQKPKVQDSLAGDVGAQGPSMEAGAVGEMDKIADLMGTSLRLRDGELAADQQRLEQFDRMSTGQAKVDFPNDIIRSESDRGARAEEGADINQRRWNAIRESPEWGFATTLQGMGAAAMMLAAPFAAPGLALLGVGMRDTGDRIKGEASASWRASSNEMMKRFLDEGGTGITQSVDQRNQKAFLDDMRFAITANGGKPLADERTLSIAAMHNVDGPWALNVNQADIPLNPEDIRNLKKGKRDADIAAMVLRKKYLEEIDSGTFDEAAEKSRRLNDPRYLEEAVAASLGEGWREAIDIDMPDVVEDITASGKPISSLHMRERAKNRPDSSLRNEQRTYFTDMLGKMAGMASSDLVEITIEEKEKYPLLRNLESSETFVSQANAFLETLIEDGKIEKVEGGWTFVYPKMLTEETRNVKFLGRYRRPIFAPLVDKVWKKEKPPSMDEVLMELDNNGFSKEAHTDFGAMITAMR